MKTFPLFKVEPEEADLSLTEEQKETLVGIMLAGDGHIFRLPDHDPYLVVQHAGFDLVYHRQLGTIFENLLARPIDVASVEVNGKNYECVRLVTYRMKALIPWYDQFKDQT